MTTPQPLLCVHRDLQHLVVWLTALSPLITTCHLWILAYLTARKQKCELVHMPCSITQLGNRKQTGYYRPLCASLSLLQSRRRQFGNSDWRWIRLEFQTKKLINVFCFFFLTVFCFGGWAVSLSGLVFSLWCASCSVILSVWVKKKQQPWSDIMIPLQLFPIVSLISPRNPTIRKDKLVTIRR